MSEFYPHPKGEGPYIKISWRNEYEEGELTLSTQLLLSDILNRFFMFLVLHGYVFNKEEIIDAAELFWPDFVENKDNSSIETENVVDRLQDLISKVDIAPKKKKKEGKK